MNLIIKMSKVNFLTKGVIIAGIAILLTYIPAESRFLFFGSKKTEKEKQFDEKEKELSGKDASGRGRTAEQIIKIDKEKGTQAVIRALGSEESDEIKKDMINSLGNSGNEDAIQDIEQHLNSENKEIRLQSASALAKLGDAEALEELEKTALDITETRGRRSLAIRSLGNIKSDESVSILKQVLEDEDFAIRLQAVAALGKIGTQEAHRLIENMTDDPDERVSELAKDLLKGKK